MKQSKNILIYSLFFIIIAMMGLIIYVTYKAPKLKVIDLPKVEGELGDIVNINLLPHTSIRENNMVVKDGNKYILSKEGEGVLLIDNKKENIIYKAIVSTKKKSTFTGIITDKLSAPLSDYYIMVNKESPIAISNKGKFTIMLSNPSKSLEGSTLSLLNKDKSKKITLGTIQLIQHQYRLIPNQSVCTVPNTDLNIIKLNIAKPKVKTGEIQDVKPSSNKPKTTQAIKTVKLPK